MKQYSISLRIWHPTLSAQAIGALIGREPTVAQTVGEPRLTPKGNPVGRLNDESFCAFPLVDRANGAFEEGIVDVLPILHPIQGALTSLSASGGVCEIYVWIFPEGETNLGFLLDAAVVAGLQQLGVRVAVELMLLD